ncbi:glycosyl hydrolase family 28-related protein [Algoriphagus litoralis]|uniref:glycosyl hydrolase family 28-related protein n=1 Tax=Algoriphagus litoralis TaxID=2202829 RepID=UPI000DB970EE|nr:glycosyl hydrolase family 28-related protein [Algoriphagus litoralis]
MKFLFKILLLLTFNLSLICTLQGQEVNILHSGADPSGSSDNSTIINKLIDSLYAVGGGVLVVPEGKYLLHDAIILKSNIHLKGENMDKSIFFRQENEGNWANTKNQALITTVPSTINKNITLENIGVDGRFAKNATGAKGGICLRNCTNSSIRNVSTTNTWHGVAFYDFKGENSQNTISGVVSQNAHAFTSKNNSGRPRGILTMDNGSKVIGSKSIGAGTGFFADGNNITFIGNHAENWFEDNGYYLIVNDLTVLNCSAKGGPSPEKGFGSGFAIAYKKGALIENSIAENCSNYGFRIHVPQSETQLINNKALGCGIGFGIETASHPFPEVSNQLFFSKNIAVESGLHGFLFRQMSNSEVVNNKAVNGNQRGVTLSTRGAFALKEFVSNTTFKENECTDTQATKTQLYGFYDFSVNQIEQVEKRGKNNLIQHKSKTGIDEF